MLGSTNAFLYPMVSSVNGKSGIVVLSPNDIEYDPSQTYEAGTVGAEIESLASQISNDGVFEQSPIENVAVASFNDGADNVPVRSLIVDITPQQNMNGYEHPWPAGGGNNKWNEVWEVGAIDSLGQNAESNMVIRSKDYNPILPQTTYYYFNGTGGYMFVSFYDTNQDFLSGVAVANNQTFTSVENAAYLRFMIDGTYGTTYKNDIAINYPASVTTYSPYANVCPISGWNEMNVYAEAEYDSQADPKATIPFVESAGIVFGGTHNVTTGKLSVAFAYIASYNGEAINEPWLSSMDVYEAGHTPTIGAQVVYPRTSAVEYALPPIVIKTLMGDNCIWADSGNINYLVYYLNSVNYINSENQRIASMIADNVENSMTVTQNYPLGALIAVVPNGGLYKTSRAITSGETLIVGTNCTKTSIDTEFNNKIKQILSNIALDYDPLYHYTEDDLCFHEGQLYICVDDTPSPAGQWDDTYWLTENLADVIALIMQYVRDINEQNTPITTAQIDSLYS